MQSQEVVIATLHTSVLTASLARLGLHTLDCVDIGELIRFGKFAPVTLAVVSVYVLRMACGLGRAAHAGQEVQHSPFFSDQEWSRSRLTGNIVDRFRRRADGLNRCQKQQRRLDGWDMHINRSLTLLVDLLTVSPSALTYAIP